MAIQNSRPPIGPHEAWELLCRTRSALKKKISLARRAVSRAPVVEQCVDFRYAVKRTRHVGRLPAVSPDSAELVDELRRHAAARRSIRLPDPVLTAADAFVEELRRPQNATSCVRIPRAKFGVDPTVFKWGLMLAQLDLAECYIGLPVPYLGVEIKRERPESSVGESGRQVHRQWHVDHEDRRMLKIIVYLSDVNRDSGPFEYLDPACTWRAAEALKDWRGIMTDSAIEDIIPRGQRRQITGPRLTAVYADTSQILHRVNPPVTSDRYSATFVYSTITPYYTYPHFMMPRKALMLLLDELSPRQQAALTIA